LYGLITAWGLKPIIFSTNSVLKPFITDITIINTATPRLIPIKENIEITFKKPSFFLVFKYLKAISFSNLDKKKESCDALKNILKQYPDSKQDILKKTNFLIQESNC
jgi:hypothetical protein